MSTLIRLKNTVDQRYLGYARESLYATHALFKRHKHEKKFVIFGRGRSGSTLLVDLLNSSADIYCDGEILNRPVISVRQHIINCSKRKPSRVYGFKLLSYQLRSVHKLARPESFLRQLSEEMGYQIIFITRKNLLRQTLSKHYAAFRNSWHENQMTGERPKMKVDVQLLLKHLQEGHELGRYEERVVSNLPHLPLTYEDNLSDPEKQDQTIALFSDFMGLEKFKSQSRLKKIAGQHYSDFIENHAEMEKALSGGPFEKYLSY